LLERDPFAEEIAEFDLYAARLAAKKPDGVLAFANSSDVRKIVRALRGAGINPIVVSTNGPSAQDLARDSVAVRDFTGLKYLALFLPDRAQDAVRPRVRDGVRARVQSKARSLGRVEL
jgi:ABC-type branched-subunit amino acid transport system substrate-binding protein